MKPHPALPDVSILMTVWNSAPFIAEAITSVLTQHTTATWQLLIVDDGSTDASPAIAQSFSARDSRITLHHHPHRANRGISASRNLAMRHARAPILALLDSDDVWLPYRLEHQLQQLRACPEAAMIYGQAERWVDDTQPFDEHNPANGENRIPPLTPPRHRAGLLHGPMLLEWFLTDESLTPCTCSVLVKTAVARRLGGFEASFRGLYDDQVFYAKVALAEPILVDPRCVARYRRHRASCCARAANTTETHVARQHFLAWLSAYSARQSPFASHPQPQAGEADALAF